jgi:hypothetical protein
VERDDRLPRRSSARSAGPLIVNSHTSAFDVDEAWEPVHRLVADGGRVEDDDRDHHARRHHRRR